MFAHRASARLADPGAHLTFVACFGLAVLLTACGSGNPPPLVEAPSGWSQTGEASWYGPKFDGRRTASGERFDMEAMTAAHRRLPFGTRVVVHNLDNGRAAEVRINDRGPFVDGRIIDLSRGAARAIGMLGAGTARVRIEVVEASALLECSRVQVGAFDEPANARERSRALRAAGEPASVVPGADGYTRVFLGPYEELEAAEEARDRYAGVLRRC